MSKKKAFSGSTMTLKDFHGGSIPSDLPLPSAPGVMPRPADRAGFDRQGSWGNTIGGRFVDHRLRPSSSGSIRNLDDNKTPFLTTSPNIGRNFDEDERKPLDGGGSIPPRRVVSDDSAIGVSAVRSEARVDSGRIVSLGGGNGSSYSARVVEGQHSGSRTNAWGVKKEAPTIGSAPWNGQSTVSKFAQASALDKISSGRWQTKPVQHQVDVEIIKPSDLPISLYGRESDSYGGEREYYETTLVAHVERGLVIEEGTRGGFKEMPVVERMHSPVQSNVLFTNECQPAHPEGKHGGPLLPQLPEVSERPKLKLLPRTKPFDVQEPLAVGYSQGIQQPIDTGHSQVRRIHGNGSYVNPIPTSSEANHGKPRPASVEANHEKPRPASVEANHEKPRPASGEANHEKPRPASVEANHEKPRPASGEANHGKPGVSGNEAAGQKAAERPKLNLKPRTQPADNAVGSTQSERKALFGGARPREMILKERDVHDVVNNHDEAQSPIRIKKDSPRAEVLAYAHANTSRQGEKVDNISIDQKNGRGHEKRDQRADFQRADVQRKNWRNDNWRSGRDTEKHQQERQPSPETWRKPVEQPKPSDTENSGLRFGKAVSAVDLAQAFSRSVSSLKPVDQFPGRRGHSGQKGLPVRSQVPFSRLTGSTRPQINGY